MDCESVRSIRSDHSGHQSRPLPRPPTLGNRDPDPVEGGSVVSEKSQTNRSTTSSHRHRHHHRSCSKQSRGTESEDCLSDVRGDRINRSTVHATDNVDTRSEGRMSEYDDTTTAVTGTTSEAGYSTSVESMARLNRQLEESIGFACARYIGTVVAGFVGLLAFVSPIIMVVLPKTGLITMGISNECQADCEGLLIAFSFKLVVLLIGSWALFFRRPRATLPRISVFHALAVLFIFVVTVAFWLFYGVRIISSTTQQQGYPAVVAFAASMVDALLFVHYLAVILLELRQLQAYYVVKIVRSPDGQSQSYTVGQMSVQHLAVHCLDKYYCEFQVYNPYLERMSSRRISRMTDFKVYNVDGDTVDTTASSVHHSHAVVTATGTASSVSRVHRPVASEVGSLISRGHNDRFYEELEYERKVRKRKARLVVAADEAFTYIKRQQFDKGSSETLSPLKAAQNIFPRVARALQKYLRATRQQPRYTTDMIVNHLAECIHHDLSAKAFIEPYLTQGAIIWNDKECGSGVDASETHTWTIISEKGLSYGIGDNTVLKIRRGDVTLLVTVRRLPHFNLTEDVFNGKNAKFTVQLSSETSV